MEYQAASLILNPPKTVSKTGVYIAPNDLCVESNLGMLFIIIEINSHEKSTRRTIEQIISDLSQEYYQSATSNIEIALETTCQKFNENIISSSDKDKKWFAKLNILIAAAKDQNLVLSNFGHMSAILFRQSRTVNILETSDEEAPKKTKSFKIFSQLTSGEIKENDIVVFTNPSLLDYFSYEKIRKTCQTAPPHKAAETLSILLSGNLTPTAFGTAIFKIEHQASPETQAINQLQEGLTDLYGPQSSMDQLSSLERKTGRLLTASLWPNIKRIADKILFGIKKILSFNKSKKLKLPKERTKPQKSKTSEKISSSNLVANISQPFNGLLKLIPKLFNKIPKINIKAKSGPVQPRGPEELKTRRPQPIPPPKTLYSPRKLSITSRVYLIAALVLIAAFVLSTIFISHNKASQKEQDEFNQQIELVKQKADAAEAALIYQDEDKARKLLDEARDSLSQIANSGSKIVLKNSRKIELINQSIESITFKIYHLTKLDRLDNITNFATIPNKAPEFKLNDFTVFNNILYVLDNQNTFYKIDPQTSSFTPISKIEENQQFQKLAFLNDETVMIQGQDNNFFNFNTDQQDITEIDISLRDNTQTADWQIYADNLYLIDYFNNQIYKLSKSANNFTPRTAWLKDSDIVLTQNSNLTIDGNIWLNIDGRIVKLFKGLEQNFALSSLEKELGSNAKIYTNPEINYLFILDYQNYKIIIMDKPTGKVKQQFVYPDRYELSAITSSPDGQTIYLLGKEKVYKLIP